MIAKPDSATERVVTPMRRKLLERIEDFRYARRIPSRAEAVRQLVEAGLREAKNGKADCGGATS
jgi:metal-responsive CopG/Arc/MetJ family transcriptional regulator